MPAESTEWSEVELTSHRGAVAQRWIAAVLALAGVAGVVIGVLTEDQWWVVAVIVAVSLLMIAIGISLWASAGANAQATVRLLDTGTPVALRVLNAEEVHDDSIVYRLLLRLPEKELVVVQHQCSQGACIAAARAAPDSEVPAILDPATRSWGVVHGRLDG
ncbi:hypothetical protein [Streptomyces sp. AC495_CC817]|uniref:hypothetical protein n=1 Tax=Streptomyces sp. AC495_CC817 TaxID=2823900 RepID=UPI001C272BBF|nr:hypothetical protein [Streptomyces sp. AC495_CC817]